jgi:Ran GTPase-activating protein (RanGAP) involved in mRNA processing and transport
MRNGKDVFVQAVEEWGRQTKQVVHYEDDGDSSHPQQPHFQSILHVPRRRIVRVEGVTLDEAALVQLDAIVDPQVEQLELVSCHLNQASRRERTLLGKFLAKHPQLQSLDLSGNQLEHTELEEILSSLAGHCSLCEVILEDNQLKGRDAGLCLGRFLQVNSKVLSLNVLENPLGREGMVELATALTKHGRMERLSLACDEGAYGNRDSSSSLVELLVNSLLENGNLKDLRLCLGEIEPVSGTAMERGARQMARLLSQHSSLQSLSIFQSHDFLDPDAPAEESRTFCQALAQNTTLRALSLEGSGICNETVKELCEALVQNKTLQHLDLLSNYLGDEGHAHMCTYLPKFQHLRSLLMEGEGVVSTNSALGMALSRNTSLTEVQLLDVGAEVAETVDRFGVRNDYIIKVQSLLQATATTTPNHDNGGSISDGLGAAALAKLSAVDPIEGATARWTILQHLMGESLGRTTMPPCKRPRLA